MGTAYVYEPVVSREAYTAGTVRTLVDQLFDGRREALLCHLLGTDTISRKDLTEIRRVLTERGDT